MNERERWAEVRGFPCYGISDQGRVRNTRTGRLLKPYLNGRSKQHLCVTLYGEKRGTRAIIRSCRAFRYVHLLVMEAFGPPQPYGCLCCHDNSNSRDNRLSNLRWDTFSANKWDERTPERYHANLSSGDISAILARLDGGECGSRLAAEYNVPRWAMRMIEEQGSEFPHAQELHRPEDAAVPISVDDDFPF